MFGPLEALAAYPFSWYDIFDIVATAAVLYYLMSLVRGTLAVQVLKGLGLVAFVVVIAFFFHLQTLTWIVEKLIPVLLIALIVLFQPEIRRGLARLGQQSFGALFAQEEERLIDTVVRSALTLADKGHGGLIVLERETGLTTYIETGTPIHAEVSSELIVSLFAPGTPLHDGAVIIRGGTVAAAGCLLPLSKDPTLESRYGTRHRAAIGLSEETDSVIVVVSEETGAISIAMMGQIVTGLDAKTLKEMLSLYTFGVPGGRTTRVCSTEEVLMFTETLRNLFLRNLHLKILAIFLSLLMWVYVVGEQSSEYTMTLPLNPEVSPSVSVSVGTPETVQVTFRGPRYLLTKSCEESAGDRASPLRS